jgi:hypothetical protein
MCSALVSGARLRAMREQQLGAFFVCTAIFCTLRTTHLQIKILSDAELCIHAFQITNRNSEFSPHEDERFFNR